MANVPVGLRNLVELDDGRLEKAFDRSLKAAIQDLRERPADNRARKITLTIEMKPREHRGDFDGADIDYYVTSKTPHEQGNTTVLAPSRINNEWTLAMPTEGNNANQSRLPFKRDGKEMAAGDRDLPEPEEE